MCDKCYQEYVECGMSSYHSTRMTTASSTVDSGADSASESTSLLADRLEGGLPKGSGFTTPRIPVLKPPRIPVKYHSWQSLLVSKVRQAVVRGASSTTETDATSGHGSEFREPTASVQSHPANDESKEDHQASPREGDHRNTTAESFKHRKHYHHHHLKASAGHSKGKPRPINDTVSAGNITATNTEGSSEHHAMEAVKTQSHDGDQSSHEVSASTANHPSSSPNTDTSSTTEPKVPPMSTPTRGTTSHKKPHRHHSKASTLKHSSGTEVPSVSTPKSTTTHKKHNHSEASTSKSPSSTVTKISSVPTSASGDTSTPTESPRPPSESLDPELRTSKPVSSPSAADTPTGTTPIESSHPPSGTPDSEETSSENSRKDDTPAREASHPPSSLGVEQPSSTWEPEKTPAPTPTADW